MLFALLLTLIAIAGGASATYWYDDDATLPARLCAGACTGLTLFGLAGFILASLFGLNSLVLILDAVIMATPLWLLRDETRWAKARADWREMTANLRRAVLYPKLDRTGPLAFYVVTAVVLWLCFDRVMFEEADGIYTGVLNNFGDLPFHLSVITSFVYGGNFPPEDPTYAGVRFTYPFIVDFVAACFVRAGASLRTAMLIENFVLGLSFVGLLHRWAWVMLRDRLAALLTPVLVILSGGLGWVMLVKDMSQNEEGLLGVLKHPTHSYTILPETTWRWGNAVSALLLPQRSFLLGLPLAVLAFTLCWKAVNADAGKGKEEAASGKESKKDKRSKGLKQPGKDSYAYASSAASTSASSISAASTVDASAASLNPKRFPLNLKQMIAAGVSAGLLPLVHAHSFVVVMGVAGCLALMLWKEWRLWAIFFVAALVVAAPQLWWSTHGSAVQSEKFFGWQYGWDRGTEDVFRFWWKNTGLFIPLTLAALVWRGEGEQKYLIPRRVLIFFLPFTLCFIIPNLIRLAPWVWDNIKVLFYWYIASTPLIALLLARLWRRGRMWSVAAALLFMSLTLAGALDVWGIITARTGFKEFDRDGIALAEIIKRETLPRATILHAPIHNHLVFLTGRRSLMGYPGHIWTHGLEYRERENEIKRIYAGGYDAASLIASRGVEYVVIGPQEKQLMTVNDTFFASYTKVGEAGEYRLYKITRP